MDKNTIPSIVIAGTSSGVGKTVVTASILAALEKRKKNCQPFKVGPDYIDPIIHNRITKTPSHNLDVWLMGTEGVVKTFQRNSLGKDISVIEGVMGLYDGNINNGRTSTAEIAKLTKSPVILVIDCQKTGQSIAAIALGFKMLDKDLKIAGLIINNVASKKHESMITGAIKKHVGIPIIGIIPKNTAFHIPEIHLGLSTNGRFSGKKDELANLAEKYIDINFVQGCTLHKSPPIEKTSSLFGDVHVKIGVAYDDAFNFYYRESLKELERCGAELVYFSPLNDKSLPLGIRGLFFGGGYPELYAEKLAANTLMKKAIVGLISEGIPVYAECGGMLYLSEKLIADSSEYEMLGVLPAISRMSKKKNYLGYVEAVINKNSIFRAEKKVRGHKFHYSTVKPLVGLPHAYTILNDENAPDGFATKNIFASYIHLHFQGAKDVAKSFIERCIGG